MLLLQLEKEPDNTTQDNSACVCLFACAQASVLETMAVQMKLFDCGVKSPTNVSASQINVKTDSADKEPDEPETKSKQKVFSRVSPHL